MRLLLLKRSKPCTAKTFEEKVCTPHISQQFQPVPYLNMVWYSYVIDCFTKTTRPKCGKGVHRCVVGSTLIPFNCMARLSKYGLQQIIELFGFLLKALVASFNHEIKELIVTDGDQVVCVPAQQDVHLYLLHVVT